MSGVEKITAEIISRAEIAAAEIVKQAETDRDERKSALSKRVAASESEREATLAKEAENVIERRLTLARLDSRMLKLGAKQKIIEQAYNNAFDKISAMPAAEYLAVFDRLVTSSAADGDEVIVSKADVKRFTADWVAKIAKKTGKKLALSKDTVNSRGGLILSGASCEKDLTLETLMQECRTSGESEIIGILFE